MCYQYGIGSTGFGVWRELSAHIIATNWVMSGACPRFPVMCHWRILQTPQAKQVTKPMQKQLDKFGLITIWFAVLYWGGHLIVSLTK